MSQTVLRFAKSAIKRDFNMHSTIIIIKLFKCLFLIHICTGSQFILRRNIISETKFILL